MTLCHVCSKRIWFWQKRVKGRDGQRKAHRICKPDGFHGEHKK